MLWVGLGLLGLVAILVALVLAAEPWVRNRGVQEAANRIAEALGAQVELRVTGRPMLLHLARRHLPNAVIVAHDLPVLEGRTTINRLEVDLDDLRLVGRGSHRRLVADAGRFRVLLTNDALRAMVTLPPYLTAFTVMPNGLRLQTAAGLIVDATVRLQRGAVWVRPRAGMFGLIPRPDFRIPIPELPYGATIEDFALHTAALEVWGPLHPDQLRVDASRPWRATPDPAA